MTEKEEKIAIVKSPCCIHNKKTVFKNAMARAEAIERMKNAGLKYACRANGRDIPEEVHHHYANMMEAALDALLGGKK